MERAKRRDALGRRTDRVKGRERSKMERLQDQGLTVPEIASRLGRDPRTVRAKLPIVEDVGSLEIRIREVGAIIADPESGKGGQLVAFTLGNCSSNVLTVQRICLEVLACQSCEEPPHIEAKVIPLKYEVKLAPHHSGEYIITEDTFRYEGPSADDFDLACDSPAGLKYSARLNIYYSDLSTNRNLVLSSDAFEIHFCSEGDSLSRYIHKGYDRDRIAYLQKRRSASSDSSVAS